MLSENQNNYPSIGELALRVDTFEELASLLEFSGRELPAEIALGCKRGGGRVIRSGYDSEFDQLRELGSGGKKWILELEASEREKTRISNLKVKYNGAFGYFIEITKAKSSSGSDHYVRKQDNDERAERFYTDELRQKEKEIINAEEQAVAKEQDLFLKVVEKTLEFADGLSRVAESLAEIDLFSSWGSIHRDRILHTRICGGSGYP